MARKPLASGCMRLIGTRSLANMAKKFKSSEKDVKSLTKKINVCQQTLASDSADTVRKGFAQIELHRCELNLGKANDKLSAAQTRFNNAVERNTSILSARKG